MNVCIHVEYQICIANYITSHGNRTIIYKKTFCLLALVGVKSLTLMPAIWLIQSAFSLVGWYFLPDEDGKMAETIWAVP